MDIFMECHHRNDDHHLLHLQQHAHREEHGHRPAFLSLSCGAAESSEQAASTPAPAPPPRNNQHHRLGRRRGRGSLFECRTCGRQFATFQALGGHRTSHLRRPAPAKKPPRRPGVLDVHACATCGLGFSMGQALGGHMRRHRRRRAMVDSDDVDDLGLLSATTKTIVYDSMPSLQLLDLFV